MLAAALLFTLALVATVPATAGMRGRMLHLINDTRRAHGEHVLQLSRSVSVDAHHHSHLMADRGYLFHTKNVPALLGNRPWRVWGENIAKAGSVTATFRGWMRSAPHRANILNPGFRHVGIGIFAKGRYVWSTADFWG
jgi:uncharacterized protein YkwD